MSNLHNNNKVKSMILKPLFY